jgi:hypothetical protein
MRYIKFQKFTPKTKQLAKILSGGRSSQIVDLMQRLRERPTPKFSEAVASCAGANVSYTSLIIAVSINRLGWGVTVSISGGHWLSKNCPRAVPQSSKIYLSPTVGSKYASILT